LSLVTTKSWRKWPSGLIRDGRTRHCGNGHRYDARCARVTRRSQSICSETSARLPTLRLNDPSSIQVSHSRSTGAWHFCTAPSVGLAGSLGNRSCSRNRSSSLPGYANKHHNPPV
jgi:hypothetical protein